MEKKLILVVIYSKNHELCLQEQSLSVSKTSDSAFLAWKERNAILYIGTNQMIIYIYTLSPVANGTLNSNILSRER